MAHKLARGFWQRQKMKHMVTKLQNGLDVRMIESMGFILVDEILGLLHNLETKTLQCAHT
jgi:hypothetical protein